MRSSDIIPLITVSVSGIFVLLGYMFQKVLEHRRAVADQRRETYSMFLKATFAAIESRVQGRMTDISDQVFWKAQIALYTSDEVIRNLAKLEKILRPMGQVAEPRQWKLRMHSTVSC